MGLAQSSTESYTPDALIASNADVVTEPATVASGANVVRGEVVGRVTASGKIVACDPGAADGSQTPIGIMVHDIDASGGDEQGQIYTGGAFHRDELTWHAGFDDASKAGAFDGTNIVTL